jgi:hypothetical protein
MGLRQTGAGSSHLPGSSDDAHESFGALGLHVRLALSFREGLHGLRLSQLVVSPSRLPPLPRLGQAHLISAAA